MVRGADCEQSLIIGLSGEITANCLPAKPAFSLCAGEQKHTLGTALEMVSGIFWRIIEEFFSV